MRNEDAPMKAQR